MFCLKATVIEHSVKIEFAALVTRTTVDIVCARARAHVRAILSKL